MVYHPGDKSIVCIGEMPIQRYFSPDPPLAQPHEGFINHNPGQPGGKGSLFVEPFEVDERLVKAFLHHIPRVLAVAGYVEGHSQHPRFVAAYEQLESVRLSVSRCGDERRIRLFTKRASCERAHFILSFTRSRRHSGLRLPQASTATLWVPP